jgi:hypothetical protein
MVSFSCAEKDTPLVCSPSRNVVSIISIFFTDIVIFEFKIILV